MSFIRKNKKPVADELIEFGPENELVSVSRYKEMVESMVQKLADDNSILRKNKSGETITDEELNEIAQMMNEKTHLLQRNYCNGFTAINTPNSYNSLNIFYKLK